jgi:hypothetical protein
MPSISEEKRDYYSNYELLDTASDPSIEDYYPKRIFN